MTHAPVAPLVAPPVALLVTLAACGGAGDTPPHTLSRRFDVPLWPEGPPSGNGLTGAEQGGACVANVSEALLSVSAGLTYDRLSLVVTSIPGSATDVDVGFNCIEAR